MRASERAGGVSCFAFAAATHTFLIRTEPVLIMVFFASRWTRGCEEAKEDQETTTF